MSALDKELEVYPAAYGAGTATAHRLINSRLDRERIPFALALVQKHLDHWPISQSKNGLTKAQHARSRGFRDALRDYLFPTPESKIGE